MIFWQSIVPSHSAEFFRYFADVNTAFRGAAYGVRVHKKRLGPGGAI